MAVPSRPLPAGAGVAAELPTVTFFAKDADFA